LQDGPASARLRHWTLLLTGAAMVIAAVLAAAVGIKVDATGLGTYAEFTAGLLLVFVIFSRKGRLAKPADVLGALVLVWLSGIVCGLISLMGLRLHLPLLDGQLFALDHLVGIDTIGIDRLLSQLPWNVMIFVQLAYKFTIPILLISMIAVALLGGRIETWRAAFCFVGCVLTVCVLSIATPAKGMGTWLGQADLAALPRGATRYFWRSFDAFYSGANPPLRLESIDGVVSFPSFHIAMGLIVVALWRRWPGALPLVILWLIGMLTGTLAIGGHYVVDLVAGAIIWAAWFAASLKIAPPTAPTRAIDRS
jgi:membrane-associated phospholipid phosphatase